MPYLTSWDANVFLCLLSLFPEEVVRRMIKMVKERHEDYVTEETLNYWLSIAPTSVLLISGGGYYESRHAIELKKLWNWRSPNRRKKNVVNWTRSDHDWNCRHIWEKEPYQSSGKGTSREGYWNSGEAWWYSISDSRIDTSDWEGYEEEIYFDMKQTGRRKYVTKWYENIHEGRYFLFFKENDIFSEDVYNDYDKYMDTLNHKSLKSICDIDCRAQVAQDLLTIDGSGIGKKPGETIQHIDDLFKKKS